MNKVLVHELIPALQAPDVCACLSGLPYRIFFDSAETAGKYARYSFVAADPVSVITAKGSSIELRDFGTGESHTSSGNVLSALRPQLQRLHAPLEVNLPPFQGGAAGYIGYEFGAALEGVLVPKQDDLNVPDVCLGLYDTVFSWDHLTGRAWLVSRSAERQHFFLKLLEKSFPYSPAGLQASAEAAVSSSITREEYRTAIGVIREYIAAGDIFQANFAQRFSAPLRADPWQLYLELRAKNPAPFACFFEAGDITLVSASPERFIRVDSNQRAETRPIKGTRPRKLPGKEDERSRLELASSEKDNAEHVMIVDVLRNDLSRVCKTGSVRVTALAEPEAHPTVHHLVSTITGDLRDDCDAIDLLLASLPGGSITGAPKIRAMQIIAELEPVRRDAYCGCILYLAPSGEMDSSIVIRTFLAKNREVFFSAGGGIVADSDADMEFEETLHKAAALFAALKAVG